MWKVMLADDEKSIRTALGTLIDWQSLDCEVVYMARSGQDVLDHIGQYRPDLLITDIRMPGVDGVELANRLSGSELPIPIIFLTAYTDFSYAQAAVRYSVADYIVKPNVLEELPQAIRRIQERFGMQPAEQRRRIQQEVLRASGRHVHRRGAAARQSCGVCAAEKRRRPVPADRGAGSVRPAAQAGENLLCAVGRRDVLRQRE